MQPLLPLHILKHKLIQAYSIPAAPVEHCVEVKRSKFIARIAHAEDRISAMKSLEQAKQDYPDARHHCWAYLIGHPSQPSNAAFSDDGEPSGTAGKPILNVLNHSGIGDILVVVIRYFGGIKLGAGGLVRAYSSSTQQAIDLLETEQLIPTVELSFLSEYALEPELRRFIESQKGSILSAKYEMELFITAKIPIEAQTAVIEFVAGRRGLSLISDTAE